MTKKVVKIACLLFFTTAITSCQLGRYVWYGESDLNDHKIFPHRKLGVNEAEKFRFTTTDAVKVNLNLNSVIEKHNWLIKTKDIGEYPLGESQESFESFLKTRETVAFLLIRNDTILYERYFDEYSRESIVPSFSIAKSITSILIGCAIDDGLIHSVNEPIIYYIPELERNGFDKITVKNLLQMTSGIDFKENYYNPFGDVARLYYGTNLRKAILSTKPKLEPNQIFNYNSGDSQLLGLVLERALENRNITQYMQEKIWGPLGMEYSGSWSLDREKNGLEKTFCCLNARAVDFAKIGRLYLHKGRWNGKQIVSEQWVKESTRTDTSEGSAEYYQYQWWVSRESFAAEGLGGQMIYVHPAKDIIIVRLGKDRGNINWKLMCNAIAISL